MYINLKKMNWARSGQILKVPNNAQNEKQKNYVVFLFL